MKSLVLDASVAIKWAMPLAREPLTDESLRLFKRYADGEVDFIVPDVFWAEVGNVLWKGTRQRRWRQDEAEAVAADMQARDFKTVSSLVLLPEALRIAFAHDRAVYDCLYVALAVQFKRDLVTADERLANALAARFPVKWLGAF
ncbi:MAG TPA: type II toxin-antitoxin system VapC family toxin [Candidatus Sulfotelmatobacter sp.]|nr:type II toxin-antitoxin system VapC family toxin [Candidatus Sulfotelmatobacter sp.]